MRVLRGDEKPCLLITLSASAGIIGRNNRRRIKMRLNKKPEPIYTYEGGKASHITPEQQLRRSVMSCFLWEKESYEDGQSIADRIESLAGRVSPNFVHSLAIEARTKHNMRHAPLLLLSVRPNADAIYDVIQRADELTEIIAIHWRDRKKPIPAQMKKGIARAFTKFDEYALAKYNRDGVVKLRDVLFMVHAKPKDAEQAALWKRLVDGNLNAPDTWEVTLSSGADKKDTFERLLTEEKLGYLALLRNLSNMAKAGVDSSLVEGAIVARKGAERVLPFRFIAAARHAPQYEPALDRAMLKSIDALPKLSGKTVVLIDVSGSMKDKLSVRSDMTRMDAAAALGSIIQSDSLQVFTFSDQMVEVPPRRGMAGVDAIIKSQFHGSTNLRLALDNINSKVNYDRLIVITDEQSRDGVTAPKGRGYMINVASAKNGVGYGQWTKIDGFSENVIRYIYETENQR
jgi:60 kDa SS-A/Ro ribonucleoprotein